MDKITFDFVYISDDTYVVPMITSIISLIANTNSDVSRVKIHILLDNVFGEKRALVDKLCSYYSNIVLHEVDSTMFDKAYTNGDLGHVSKSALLKFNLPNILTDLNTVVYLDCDIIVQHDISDIFTLNIDQYLAGAVNDLALTFNDEQKHPGGLPTNGYFNSGVLLLNLKRMRELDIPQKLLEYKLNGVNSFMDQDALNVVLHNNTIYLDFKYNFLSSLYDKFPIESIYEKYAFEHQYSDYSEYLNEMYIVHLTGPYKPWIFNVPYFSDIYLKYYRMIPFEMPQIILKSLFLELKNKPIKKVARELLIPYNQIQRESKLIVYGAGEIGRHCVEQITELGYGNVVLWVDQKYNVEKNIYPIDAICEHEYDYILIAIKKDSLVKTVRNELHMKYGIPFSKIISAIQWK